MSYVGSIRVRQTSVDLGALVAEESQKTQTVDPVLAERIILLISETQEIPLEKLSLDGALEQSGLTSLNALSIAFEIENEFGVAIPDEQAMQITSIRHLVELLQSFLDQRDQQACRAAQS